jgi:hypothetical protein
MPFQILQITQLSGEGEAGRGGMIVISIGDDSNFEQY